MQKLKREDWLPQAQRLAVGRSDRIIHKGDGSRRSNLVIYHTPDGWNAWCHACNVGDGVKKTHIRLSERAPMASTSLDPPTDIKWSWELPEWRREQLVRFLLSKGLVESWLPRWGYSEHRGRLILNPTSWADDQYLGRDITGDSSIKWIAYGVRGKPYVVERATARTQEQTTLYLTEDVLSMYKLGWVLGLYHSSSITNGTYIGTTLGTAITPKQLSHIIGMNFRKVVVFYDGDGAGSAGSGAVSHRIRSLMPLADVVSMTAPYRQDPKDMQAQAMLDHLEKYRSLPL